MGWPVNFKGSPEPSPHPRLSSILSYIRQSVCWIGTSDNSAYIYGKPKLCPQEIHEYEHNLVSIGSNFLGQHVSLWKKHALRKVCRSMSMYHVCKCMCVLV